MMCALPTCYSPGSLVRRAPAVRTVLEGVVAKTLVKSGSFTSAPSLLRAGGPLPHFRGLGRGRIPTHDDIDQALVGTR
jgi:hypothetical protein